MIVTKQPYEVVHIGEFTPSDRKKRYQYIQDLQKGLSKRCALCTYSVGGSLGNYHFVWCLPDEVSLEDLLQQNQKIIEANAPVYHSQLINLRCSESV